ncbi:MAG: hypothetical protein E4H40_07340 [Candidatus Brocadiia bacterium]|nr:MAG: hypothetical protein E4H40_07340 [Candidatus Brocadiia bacterium]
MFISRIICKLKIKRKPYTPERAYRTSVRPLAVFFVAGGIFLFFGSLSLPITMPIPFIKTESINRIIMALTSLILILIGTGLFFKSKVAWYGLFLYIAGGTLFISAGFILFPSDQTDLLCSIMPIILDTSIGIGIYFATKLVFVNKDGKS